MKEEGDRKTVPVDASRPPVRYPAKRALLIEDARMVCADLRSRGYYCDRIARDELMAHARAEYFGGLNAGDYHL